MEEQIIQNMIYRLGQSRDERMAKALGVHFADVDERSPEALLRLTKKLAAAVSFYRTTTAAPAGNWSPFFPEESEIEEVLGRVEGALSPNLALYLSFLALYRKPQEVLNRVTGRHLDFYYQEVLRFQKRGALPDRAHLLIELKKNAPPILITPQQRFSAGKDMTGVEQVYAPVRETVINAAQVDSLRSIFVDPRGRGTVRYAPVADSSDGLGGKLEGESSAWDGFGGPALPEAEVGFALASPFLRMKEGVRKVTVTLTLNNVDPARLNGASMSDAFDAFLTGEKKWLGPYSVSPVPDEDTFRFDVTVPEGEKGVVDYQPALHGYAYAAEAPVLQLLLKPGAKVGYRDFDGVVLEEASLTVEVSGITSLNLENDGGALDPKKAFLPFGSAPTAGSRFRIGCPEALSKKLSELKLKVQWKDAPTQFSTWYQNYGVAVANGAFTANASFRIGGEERHVETVALFETGNAAAEHTIPFSLSGSGAPSAPFRGAADELYALGIAGSRWATLEAKRRVLQRPIFSRFKPLFPEEREGFITFSLNRDFLHAAYRKKYVENVLVYGRTGLPATGPVILNEPYTPAVQSISLSYTAHAGPVKIGSAAIADFSDPEIHFFHLAYFGQMREHGYQRAQFPFLADKRVPLLPAYPHEGALLIGLSGLQPGDSTTLLFQVAEGSTDPDLPPEEIDWSVLCDNYWKPLDRSGVVLDTTGGLLTSGTIRFVIPKEATISNTILPSDRIWIKGAVARHVAAVGRLIDVAANAVEVQFVDQGNDPGHLATPLPPGKIAKLKNGLSGVKGVKQPYSSFGGKPVERAEALSVRASERLRHKNRAVTGWDYERIILEAFPGVRQVKAIPHAREGNWLAPGNVLIVVVPDLRNRNAVDLLHPKVDAETIRRITAHLKARTGMQVNVKVKNPNYQAVRLDFKVKFRTGYEFNFYSGELNAALIRFLSPWAFDPARELAFGGKVYKSVLLDFVEDLDSVDYLTDFKMVRTDGPLQGNDLNEAKPETPDAILVSAEKHIVREAD